MDTQQFLSHLEELYEIKQGSLTLNSCLSDFPDWSSLAQMDLISMVDREYDQILAPRSILACRTVADLVTLIHGDTSSRDAA